MKFYLLLFVFFFGIFSSLPSIDAQEIRERESMDHSSNHLSEDSQESLPLEDFEQNDKNIESETFEAKFINMLVVLGLLIGFMLLASWALKRMMKSKVTQLNTGSSIKVLESRYLSPRATLHLIEIEDQKLLIGESPTSISSLTLLSPKQIPPHKP